MSYQSEVLADSPSWYYRFEEPVGGGLFLDSSPNAIVCNESGGTMTRSVPGAIPASVGITAASAASLSLGYTAGPHSAQSLEGWYKWTGSSHVRIEQNRGGTGQNGLCLQLQLGSTGGFGAGDGQITAFFNATAYWLGIHTTSTYNDSNWHHVVATWSGGGTITTAQLAIYVDGVAAATTADSGNTGTKSAPVTGTFDMSLFNDAAGDVGGSHGTVSADEMAFYPGALSAGRVAAHFGATTDPVPGGLVEFSDQFVDISADIIDWTITRGAAPELTGGSQAGSATITLKNTPNDQYNPENASGPYYGNLHDGPRVWIGINNDGTLTSAVGKTVYGLFAGRITDLSTLPVGGATVAPTVELVCEDPLGWYGRANVTIASSTERSQYDLRVAVLDALADVGGRALEVEPTTLPLSSADGLALNILDNINQANGTRHFAKPADNVTDWYDYTTVRRTSKLDGVAEASADAASQHVTSTSGWRVSADGVINRQKASVEPILFPPSRLVWQADTLPLVVTTAGMDIWVEFGDYVKDPVVDVVYDGSSLTAVLTSFGETAKLTLDSSGTSTVTTLSISGRLVQRGSIESVVIDDLVSQALARGIRQGPDLTGDYLGTLTSAKGFAAHIVWRFGNALYRPTMTVENWFPTQFDIDLYDRISLTIAELSITGRIFEIVGLTHHAIVAALDALGNAVAYHTVQYTLQESRVQTPTQWFTLDVSTSDGPDLLAY